MVGIIVASHGKFAEGIIQSVSMIAGAQSDLLAVSLEPKMKADDFYALLDKAVNTFEDKEQIVFLIDLKGGTPYNQAKKYIENHENKWPLVTGVNFPMLMDAVFTRMFESSAMKLTDKIIKSGKNGIHRIPEIEE